MKIWVFLSVVLVALTSHVAQAAPAGLPQLLTSSVGKQERRTINKIPDPADLRADWWLYFDVPAAKLAARVAKTHTLLNRRYGFGSDGFESNRRATIARIGENLRAFVAASEHDLAAMPAVAIVQDSYTPGQALDLVSALRKARLELEFELSDTDALNETLQSSLEEIDRVMAAYLQIEPGQPSRLRTGFNILLERSAAAATEQQLRLRRGALSVREARVLELANAERLAEQRLNGDVAEAKRLDKLIESGAHKIGVLRSALFRAKRRVLESNVDTLEDQIAARYRQQLAIAAAIKYEASNLGLLELQSQRLLLALLSHEPGLDDEQIRARIDTLRQSISQARIRSKTWRGSSERERDGAGERLSTTKQHLTPSSNSVYQINQSRLRLAQNSVSELLALDEQIARLEFLSRWSNVALHRNEGPIKRFFSSLGDSVMNSGTWFVSITDRSLFKLGETPVTLSGLFKVLVIVMIAWMISWIFRRTLSQLGHRLPKDNQSLLFIISRLSHYLIMLVGVVAGLSSIGLSFTNFALVAGALALGIGFGLQASVNNFLSGLILFFERSVKVGDFVELDNGERGEVRSINVRGTVVNTNDNVDVIVPNSQFTERKVINWTLLDPFRRIHVKFRVAYESDEDKVVEAGLDAAARLSSTLTGVLGREPSVWLVDYGENGLEFELIVWLLPDAVKRPDAVFAAYQWEIRKALRRHRIEVPVPQREIRFRAQSDGDKSFPSVTSGNASAAE